jgi:small acid-soluble spore protein H (minor)
MIQSKKIYKIKSAKGLMTRPKSFQTSGIKEPPMEKQRVREILEAPNLIQVDYAGIPVYIQSVAEDNGTATVFPLDEMDHEQMVEISRLTETVPVKH